MKKILSLMIVIATAFACTDDDIRTEQDFSNGPKVVGFATGIQTVPYFSDEGVVLRHFPMNLIGNSTDGDLVVIHDCHSMGWFLIIAADGGGITNWKFKKCSLE